MKLAPSKNPEKESKQFGTFALVFGLGSLLLWFLGVAGLAFGIRGAILSKRVNSKRYLTFSIIGIVLSLISVVYYYSVNW
jgi:hypothetical protein